MLFILFEVISFTTFPARNFSFVKALKTKKKSSAKIFMAFLWVHFVAHLLYFAMYPLLILGAFTRPLLIHDKSNCCAKLFVIWLSSLISCTLFLRRFLLSAVDLLSESSPAPQWKLINRKYIYYWSRLRSPK